MFYSQDTKGIVCGYWDYFANEDAGGWKTDGCKTDITSDNIVCQCDHLSNFAVLIVSSSPAVLESVISTPSKQYIMYYMYL